MEQRKRRLGDRYDGRKIRSLPPMAYVIPFIMKTRNDATDLMRSTLELSAMEEYIRGKREEGLKGFGFMHAMMATYVRLVSQRPALNRFIAGQRIFQRGDIVMSMMVKKKMELGAQETAIKVVFRPEDTVYDVYEKVEAAIAVARQEGDSTSTDFLARALVKLPALLLRGFVGLLTLTDYFGVMPKAVHRASPFHASVFFSNLGSIGIPPIYHHLYNFGNLPVFITFGMKYSKLVLVKDGTAEKRRYIDYTIELDERITDGHYMASCLKYMEYVLKHLSILDAPPEDVVEDVD